MSSHAKFHYSITCETSDEAVLHCLRSLGHFAEQSGPINIVWGGTNAESWRKNLGVFKMYFTRPEYRDRFIEEANRLLEGHWKRLATDDADPAQPAASGRR